MSTTDDDSSDNLLAFGSLMMLSILSFVIYGPVTVALFQLSKQFPGFRFLFSSAIADLLIILQYGVWPGFLALIQIDPLSNFQRAVQFYIDFVWFAMVWHYLLVAFSRFSAIKWPMKFRVINDKITFGSCITVWIFGFLQSLVMHLSSFHTLFYYSPAAYGTVTDEFVKYSTEGQSAYFNYTHIIVVGSSIGLYLTTIGMLIYMKLKISTGPKQMTTTVAVEMGNNNNEGEKRVSTKPKLSMGAERNLVFTCAINTLVFIAGQILITYGVSAGKWFVWTIMVTFIANSLLKAIFLFATSTLLRNATLKLVHLKS